MDLQVRLLVDDGDPSAAEQVTMPLTVAEPCDTAGYATLIADTGSGRIQDPGKVAAAACRRNDRFFTDL
jgi:hypothetical protein